jgi:effector-binding domain-containing protein
MELIVQLFRYSDLSDSRMAQRQTEINRCLLLNMNHPSIRKMHIFTPQIDQQYFKEMNPDAVFIVSDTQPTYKQLVDYANSLPAGTIATICNSDIEIGEIKKGVLEHVGARTMFAITRHEKNKDGIVSRPMIDNHAGIGSHDLITFLTPLRFDTSQVDHKQNLYGAENKLLYYIKQTGYTIYNPCFQYIIYHHHHDAVYFETYARINAPHEVYFARVSTLRLTN